MGCASSAGANGVDHREAAAGAFHDKYSLGSKIGRGGFAQVHVATKMRSGRSWSKGSNRSWSSMPEPEIAVKILSLMEEDGPEEIDEKCVARAQKEADHWTLIGSHPNCVRLYELYFDDHFCYMVMEKCSSVLVQGLDSMKDLTEKNLARMICQVLSGLAHCHKRRIVHRDIKFANILFSVSSISPGMEQQVAKLADFGLSARLPKSGKLLGVCGTAPYMCPEMLLNEGYDEKADLWSVGVIAYVLLFGEYPYMPRTQNAANMKAWIQQDKILPTFEPVPELTNYKARVRSDYAVTFVKKLLERDPDDRPAAQKSLSMPWIKPAKRDKKRKEQLPSLRPMLLFAKNLSAMDDVRLEQETCHDNCLNSLQKTVHAPVEDLCDEIAPASTRLDAVDCFIQGTYDSLLAEEQQSTDNACAYDDLLREDSCASSQEESPEEIMPSGELSASPTAESNSQSPPWSPTLQPDDADSVISTACDSNQDSSLGVTSGTNSQFSRPCKASSQLVNREVKYKNLALESQIEWPLVWSPRDSPGADLRGQGMLRI
jgi:serine/threonine protein kinase